MATENYGLPTFDGENATKPIQFKSTITQGFQKIDEVMKNNADAAAPVADLTNVVNQLNNRIPSTAQFLPMATSDSTISVDVSKFKGNPTKYACYNGILLHVYVGGQLNVALSAHDTIVTITDSDHSFAAIPDSLVFKVNAIHQKTAQSPDEIHVAYYWGYTMKDGNSLALKLGVTLDVNYYQSLFIDAIFGATFGAPARNAIVPPPSMAGVDIITI